MGFFKCFSSVAIIFLASSALTFTVCRADPDLIDSVCKQSQDFSFCVEIFNNDTRSSAADLHGLGLISISLTVIQIQDTQVDMPDIMKRLSGPLAKKRLRECQNDYNGSLGNFQNSFASLSKNAFFDAINFVRDGTNKVIHCHNIYRMGGPIATSPIAAEDTNIFKLSEIILIIIDRLIQK